MRRKPGTLLPIELSILAAGIDVGRRGELDFHGYAIAKEIRDREEARRLTAHGTLYRALERLEGLGLLESNLEAAEAAELERRPRRRLYQVTALGERTYVAAAAPVKAGVPGRARAGESPA